MSTHSTVSFADQNGNFTGMYVHMDGYPTHMGEALFDIARESRMNELVMTVADVASMSFLDPKSEDFGESAHDDVAPEEEKDWRPVGNIFTDEFNNAQEWNYVVTSDRKVRVYRQDWTSNKVILTSVISLDRSSKINWDKVENLETSTYRKNARAAGIRA